MKLHLSATKIVLALALTAVTIGFSAFSQKDKRERYSFRKEGDSATDDTTAPRKRDRYITNKDMDKLDAAMKHLDEQMEKLDERMQKIDLSKIDKQLNAAMKQVDLEKINKQVQESLKKIDYEKINRQLKQSIASIDKEKINAELARAKAQLENNTELKQLREGKMKAHVDEAMKHANEAMLKARESINNMNDFTDELQKDGLIDNKKNYKIEVKSGELYIDGKKQTKEISDKYRRFYKQENFTINMNEEEGVRI